MTMAISSRNLSLLLLLMESFAHCRSSLSLGSPAFVLCDGDNQPFCHTRSRRHVLVRNFVTESSLQLYDHFQSSESSPPTSCLYPVQRTRKTRMQAQNGSNGDDNTGGSSYDSSGSLTKGIVSSLTSVTNFLLGSSGETSLKDETKSNLVSPTSSATPLFSVAPKNPTELMDRLRQDYTENNYLWTGNIDISSFVPDCRFTDPTLSFVGVDKYVSNVGNLVPIVNFLLGEDAAAKGSNGDSMKSGSGSSRSRSELLNILHNEKEKYIETRWNMVGELNTLPWKPKIDVIGRTKFWYRTENNNDESNNFGNEAESVRVYFYDEMWEIPAGLALLQLVTPAGAIANTN